MARRRRTVKLRPKSPARVRKQKQRRKQPTRSHHRPELIGLGLVAFGLFLASVLYLGWNGGSAGSWAADESRHLIGVAAYVAPVALITVGLLMVARSALVDFGPFRTGLIVIVPGLLLTLGTTHGGQAGRGLDSIFATLLGGTGAALLGGCAVLAGAVLLTGASIGAILRRSGHVVRRAHTAAKRTLERQPVRLATGSARRR